MKLDQWFSENRPQPKFEFGQRVFGVHEGIPFIGSIGSDNLRSVEEGPMVTVGLDLPIKTDAGIRNVIRVPYASIKSTLKKYD